MDPLPPDPNYLSRLAFPEKNFIGQIVAEMLTMVCHRRLRGIDQEVPPRTSQASPVQSDI